MSHFSVFVLAPARLEKADLEGYVEGVMARYDENREVAAYKNHVGQDPPKEWWEFDFLVEQAGEGEIPGFSAEQVRATAEDWPGFVDIHNRYRAAGREDEYYEMGVDEDGAFEWSTRNPDSKWDYWLFGGRWGDWLQLKQDADAADVYPSWVLDDIDLRTGKKSYAPAIGGARVGAIDFEAMIDRAVKDATEEWEHYQGLVDRFGRPMPFEAILAEEGRERVGMARQRYWSQPAIETGYQEALARLRERKDEVSLFRSERFDQYLDTDDLVTWWQLASDDAVAPYVLVDFDGRWRAPERLGWFGATLDQVESREQFNAKTAAFVRDLPGETWLALLDCHI